MRRFMRQGGADLCVIEPQEQSKHAHRGLSIDGRLFAGKRMRLRRRTTIQTVCKAKYYPLFWVGTIGSADERFTAKGHEHVWCLWADDRSNIFETWVM